MPYKTIQQNFANGELNPKMQGRSDVDMYYKSAQKMRDVVTTPYGGFVRRPGSKMIYQGGNALASLSGMDASTEGTMDDPTEIENIADLNLTTYAEVSDSTGAQGTKLFTVEDSLSGGTSTITYYGWKGYENIVYAWSNDSSPEYMKYTTQEYPQPGDSLYVKTQGGGDIDLGDGYYLAPPSIGGNITSSTENTLVSKGVYGSLVYESHYTRSSANNIQYSPVSVFTDSSTPSSGNTVYSDTNGTVCGLVSSYSDGVMNDGERNYTRDSSADVTVTETIPATSKTTKRVSVRKFSQSYPGGSSLFILIGNTGSEIKELKQFSCQVGEEVSFFVDTDDVFESVSIINGEDKKATCKLYELELYYENESSSLLATRLIPFVFNNDQTYLISLTYKTIKIFRKDTLVATVAANTFTNDIIKSLRFAQTADTLIFVHPDLPPTKLVRGASDSSWTLSSFTFASKPNYDFEGTAPTSASTTATPDQLDGVVKITLGTSIGTNLVGQYLEGNGGRVKITSQNGTTLTGYTIVGFYSTDTIASGSWTYTTSYEPVWSATRGYPSSVTFHGGRLWFGGSKSRPQTVWGSKVGMFDKFDPTSGYDNDAIEFTLDTSDLNKITDIYSQRNLMIFTLGGEFVCASSFNEPLTPNNINAVKQTANGSWEKTRPVDIEGTVMFIERKGQGLMAFAASENTTDIYNSANSSLINSHLINSPVDISVERNNLTQQTNYVYIVNADGTLCIVNLLASQGITGGYTLWKTQGKYKNICVLPDATYTIVSRPQINGDIVYLEKLDFKSLSDGQFGSNVTGTRFTDLKLSGKVVDMFVGNEFIGSYKADDDGTITFPQVSGYATFGDSFRWLVESNFLEIPQLGVGISRKKRLATMTVRTIDTPELTVNGETQPGGEGIKDIEYYGIGDWGDKPTWIMEEKKPCHVNVMAVQMNVNYQVSTDEY